MYSGHKIIELKRCAVCGGRYRNLGRHMTAHIKKNISNKGRHMTAHTKKKISNKQMKEHIGEEKFGQSIFTCPLCETKFIVQEELMNHMKDHSGERLHCLKLLSGEKLHNCIVCVSGFQDENGLEFHLANHQILEHDHCLQKNEQHTFGKSKVSFGFENNILRKQVKKAVWFDCPYCQLRFKKRLDYKIHLRSHERKTNTGKAEGEANILTSHLDGRRQRRSRFLKIRCEKCDKSFYKMKQYKIHVKWHIEKLRPKGKLGRPHKKLGRPQKKLGQPQKKLGQPQKELGRPQKKLGQPQKKLGRPQKKLGRPQKKLGRPQKRSSSSIQSKGEFQNEKIVDCQENPVPKKKGRPHAFKCESCNVGFYKLQVYKRHLLFHKNGKQAETDHNAEMTEDEEMKTTLNSVQDSLNMAYAEMNREFYSIEKKLDKGLPEEESIRNFPENKAGRHVKTEECESENTITNIRSLDSSVGITAMSDADSQSDSQSDEEEQTKLSEEELMHRALMSAYQELADQSSTYDHDICREKGPPGNMTSYMEENIEKQGAAQHYPVFLNSEDTHSKNKQERHLPRQRLFCDICLQQFNKPEKFQLHIKTHIKHTGKTIFDNKISKCNKPQSRKLQSKKVKTYECRFCGITSKSFIANYQHERKHQRSKNATQLKKRAWTIQKQARFICGFCGLKFQYISVLKRHSPACEKSCVSGGLQKLNNQLSPEDNVKQDAVNIYKRRSYPVVSEKTQHNKNSKFVSNNVPRLSCQYCLKTFIYPGRLKLHEEKHKVNGGIRCTFCQRIFMYKRNYFKHVQETHEINITYQNMTASLLKKKKHLKYKNSVGTKASLSGHICPYCKKSFSNHSNKLRHIDLHRVGSKRFSKVNIKIPEFDKKQYEYRFECSFCAQVFNTKGNCKRHELNHINNKNTLNISKTMHVSPD